MTKTFKEYYQDPDFKKRHNDYMLQKVNCSCGILTMRCNMSKHKKTQKHINWTEKNEKNEYLQEINKLKKQVSKINHNLQKLIDKMI